MRVFLRVPIFMMLGEVSKERMNGNGYYRISKDFKKDRC